jgi:coenzyme F420-0:L-glutamate ligase/coenzyme F420-1:gamma-L-glutamate ligase
MTSLNIFAIPLVPMIRQGDDLAAILVDRLQQAGEAFQPGDILVVAQKIVTKSEDRIVHLSDVRPGVAARRLANLIGRDPRVVQVILSDSRSLLRARRGLLIVEQRSGWVCANAGVDRSNVKPDEGGERLALLPFDSDASARCLREGIYALTGVSPAVIISDSHGRAWRMGTVGVALGCAGLPPVWDQRGLHDLYGYTLQSSEECIADELAAAASLIMGQSNEGRPAVIIRGYSLPPVPEAPAVTIQRPLEMDLFR